MNRQKLRRSTRCLVVATSIFLAGATALLASCGQISQLLHRGDGVLTYYGLLAYSTRYSLDLGAVDLTQRGRNHYKFGGLLASEAVIEIVVTESRPNDIRAQRPDHPAVIRVRMESADGKIVIAEEAPLNSWVHAHGVDAISEYYRRGESRKVDIDIRLTRNERLNVRPHGGWGTYFNPQYSADYTLDIEVVKEETGPSTPARLVLRAW